MLLPAFRRPPGLCRWLGRAPAASSLEVASVLTPTERKGLRDLAVMKRQVPGGAGWRLPLLLVL